MEEEDSRKRKSDSMSEAGGSEDEDEAEDAEEIEERDNADGGEAAR